MLAGQEFTLSLCLAAQQPGKVLKKTNCPAIRNSWRISIKRLIQTPESIFDNSLELPSVQKSILVHEFSYVLHSSFNQSFHYTYFKHRLIGSCHPLYH